MASAEAMMMISQNVNLRAPHTHSSTKEKTRRKKRQIESESAQDDQKKELNGPQGGDGEMQNTDKSDSDDEHEAKKSKGPSKAAKMRKKRRSRAERVEMEKDKVEQKRLESLLFGTIYDQQLSMELGNEFEQLQGGNAQEKDAAAWFTDKTPGSQIEAYEEEDLKLQNEDGFHKKPAWVDEEEAETKVDITKVSRLRKLRSTESEDLISGTDYINRLRSQHAKLNPGTEWANLDSKNKDLVSDSDSENENGLSVNKGLDGSEYDILRSNDDLVVRSKETLLPGQIEYSMLTDANAEDRSNAVIQSVGFHRNGQLLLTAGLDKKLRFFQIDGKRNPKIQSVFIEGFPIQKASFLPDGAMAIATGRRKFFYSFDLVKGALERINCLIGREERSLESFEVSPDSSMIAFLGNDGYILLVSTKTKQVIGTLKMNGTSRALSFADDGRQLLSSGGDGQVYHWDLRMRKCIHRGTDEGCVSSSALSVSPNSNIFATGSDSGIVNIYNRSEFLGGVRKPMKVLTNLVTGVDNLKFNCDSQILAICSKMKKNSMRLVHLPSCTVFTNWPPTKSRLQYVHSLDFSPASGFLAVGNAAGNVLLYKLHHYEHA